MLRVASQHNLRARACHVWPSSAMSLRRLALRRPNGTLPAAGSDGESCGVCIRIVGRDSPQRHGAKQLLNDWHHLANGRERLDRINRLGRMPKGCVSDGGHPVHPVQSSDQPVARPFSHMWSSPCLACSQNPRQRFQCVLRFRGLASLRRRGRRQIEVALADIVTGFLDRSFFPIILGRLPTQHGGLRAEPERCSATG